MTSEADIIPSEEEQVAAAEVLDSAGRFHRWWPDTVPKFAQLDAIGREELLEVVERMLIAAARVRRKAAGN